MIVGRLLVITPLTARDTLACSESHHDGPVVIAAPYTQAPRKPYLNGAPGFADLTQGISLFGAPRPPHRRRPSKSLYESRTCFELPNCMQTRQISDADGDRDRYATATPRRCCSGALDQTFPAPRGASHPAPPAVPLHPKARLMVNTVEIEIGVALPQPDRRRPERRPQSETAGSVMVLVTLRWGCATPVARLLSKS